MAKMFKQNELFFVYNRREGFHSLDELRALTLEQKKQYRLFMGHMPFNAATLADIAPQYVTLIRHPVERVLSYYHHVMTLNPKWCNDNVSLLKYIDESEDSQITNLQTRLLSGRVGGDTQQGHLDAAIDNIRHKFSFVGLTEHFELSAARLSNTVGWPELNLRRDNVGVGRLTASFFSDRELKAIEDINEFDMELYRAAESLFEGRSQDVGSG